MSLEKNLKAFRAFGHMDVADRLAAMPSAESMLVRDGNSHIANIDLGHTHFYAGSARDYCDQQVRHYLDTPNRFLVQPPLFGSEYLMREEQLYRESYERFGIIDADAADKLDSPDGGFLVCFGLGLGYQLDKLVSEIPFRQLIIVEQYWEFMQLSCMAMDWTPLLETLRARGGGVSFILDQDPVRISNRLYNCLRGPLTAMIDGSYGFQHYKSPCLDRAHELFHDLLPSVTMSEGFFEDECVMLDHSIKNMSGKAPRILQDADGRIHKPLQDMTAFIVGSGPSVDSCLTVIGQNRDRALIISAGTGLGVLLRAGIRPHIHCEIENLPVVYDVIHSLREDGLDFSGIHLFGSTSLDPRIAEEFDEVSYFLRDSVTSTILLARPEQVLNTGPTVANCAARIAAGAGAKRIYLFGVDLGSTSPDRHHSDKSAYLQSDNGFWNSGLGMLPMDQQVTGNFRETVYTNALFMLNRSHFHNLIMTFPACRFFNCSDGVKIEGSAPLRPDLLRLREAEVPPGEQLRAFLAQFKPETDIQPKLDRIAEILPRTADEWHRELHSVLARGHASVEALIAALFPLLSLEGREGMELCVRKFHAGTITLMLQFSYFYGRRIDPDERDNYLEFLKNWLIEDSAKMKREIYGIFT